MTGSGAVKEWPWQRVALLAILLALSSWIVVRAGIYAGEQLFPPGIGHPNTVGCADDLFRFDSFYYLDIADGGYAYNGDPASSSNIVFAPLFPLLVRSFGSLTGVNYIDVGFLLNKLLFAGALYFWLLFLHTLVGTRRAFIALLALVTAAGSYSFHAFYSEASLLFFMGICFWAHSQGKHWLTALSCAALGASRVAAFPIACAFAIDFALRAYRGRARPGTCSGHVLLAVLCVSGTGAYLVYLALNHGNPFVLISQIQSVSWGRFHRPLSWVRLLTGLYFIDYALGALGRGWQTFLDIRTINWAWLALGLAASIYLYRHFRHTIFGWAFMAYFAVIYWSDASSEYLVSAHRFFALMPPIFLMFGSLHDTLSNRYGKLLAYGTSSLLLLVNLGYGLYMTATFNQGIWPFF